MSMIVSNPIKLASLTVPVIASRYSGEASMQLNVEYCNLGTGVWQIAVKDVLCLVPHNNFKLFGKVSCNLVVGQWDSDNERKPVPLGRFGDLDQANLIYKFPQVWFQVTQKTQELRAYVTFDPKTQVFAGDAKFHIDFLLQRVQ
jgi:hypothetical protein